MKIKKGDTVKVISGANLGKEGTVLKVYPKTNKVIVEGVNKIKKHAKPTQSNPDGGIMEYEAPIHASNVMIVEKKLGTTRIGYKTITETVKKKDITRKVRYSKKSGEVLD
ncbi:50S ribosomal protein L24 [Candidatus Xianfuyuplasma coldseepsis]|uniref:Large ribosomal subunit protein uL24 n=1 Tax=Candidatus Xianfuyuplasma coldseepsis TaxID=2782163 RepID=A0A7L7KRZ2_9MOLU|nr:50S ribosomal protein L24 [Xianfuyuplasma coldseepsis]QMS85189.1 50S ribosomal protein L24 [Xianfuyuplasma coldseepsis]